MKSTKAISAVVEHDNEDNNVETGQLLSAHTENSSSCHDSTNRNTATTTTLNPYKDEASIESRMHEMLLLFRLAIPTFIVQLGSVTPGFLVASYIGRTYPSEVYLDGYTIASVTTNLCILSLLQGLYSAADTLSPQAYGAGSHNQVGYIAVRGYIASMIVIVPIVLFLLLYMKQMLLWFGQDSVSVSLAYEWFRIYAMALPFYSLYQVTIKFLSAQSQMQPLLHCCILSTCIILPSLLFVFGSMLGFIGTAIALVLYHVFNSMSLIVYLYYYQPHDPLTWPGLHECVQHAIEWKPFISYMVRLYAKNNQSKLSDSLANALVRKLIFRLSAPEEYWQRQNGHTGKQLL
jgi:multidrug resistance protein, MATE family